MMNEINKQKKKRYWLWGGVVGLLIGIISGILFYGMFPASLHNSFGTFGDLFLIIIYIFGALFVMIYFIWQGDIPFFVSLLVTISSIILYFLIGALLGLLYGKIKQRKRK